MISSSSVLITRDIFPFILLSAASPRERARARTLLTRVLTSHHETWDDLQLEHCCFRRSGILSRSISRVRRTSRFEIQDSRCHNGGTFFPRSAGPPNAARKNILGSSGVPRSARGAHSAPIRTPVFSSPSTHPAILYYSNRYPIIIKIGVRDCSFHFSSHVWVVGTISRAHLP